MALGMIRAQKMKSFFSAVGAFVGVTFLIGVISIVNGMDQYMRVDFARLATKFFPGLDHIGKIIRSEDFEFRVIGVAEAQGKLFGMSLDKFVIAPYTSPMKRMVNPHKIVDGVIVKTPDLATMHTA